MFKLCDEFEAPFVGAQFMQQGNNDQPTSEKNKKSANELLIEEKENETLGVRRTPEAIRAHPAMETVEKEITLFLPGHYDAKLFPSLIYLV
ncbi:MAG: hypothetical protein A2X77_02995 [Gammaproteobacteria bacterium GWE2_42_36]|nr:MAG: hypothetical protein A2X77_02995 [Gammaproteobacteria bacterium GWE2_42_36]